MSQTLLTILTEAAEGQLEVQRLEETLDTEKLKEVCEKRDKLREGSFKRR